MIPPRGVNTNFVETQPLSKEVGYNYVDMFFLQKFTRGEEGYWGIGEYMDDWAMVDGRQGGITNKSNLYFLGRNP